MFRSSPSFLFAAFVVFACACGDDDGGSDGSVDDAAPLDALTEMAARDVSTDVSADVSTDASTDVSTDAGSDAGLSGTPSTGCVDGAGIEEGEQTFMLEGMERRYLVHLPVDYSRERTWPVVFALHGNGGDFSYWNGTSGARNVRAELSEDAIVVIALAIDGRWRDYDADRSAWPARIETELAYFDAIVETLNSDLCVDEETIFSMGFSGGGSFSGVLGCRRDYIRAFAAGGAVPYFDADSCVQTPPAWITIGEEELAPSREEFRDFFRDGAMCDASSTPIEPSPCRLFDGCATDTPVVYCEHPDGHVWPDFGTAAMWAFFGQFLP